MSQNQRPSGSQERDDGRGNLYAVGVGDKPGVYNTWKQCEEAIGDRNAPDRPKWHGSLTPGQAENFVAAFDYPRGSFKPWETTLTAVASGDRGIYTSREQSERAMERANDTSLWERLPSREHCQRYIDAFPPDNNGAGAGNNGGQSGQGANRPRN